MVWTVTGRGDDYVGASSDNIVIPSFTPAANSLLLLVVTGSISTELNSVSGQDGGTSWEQIFYEAGYDRPTAVYACLTGSSPSAGTVTLDKDYSWVCAAALAEITGDFDTAPTAMADLFGTPDYAGQYNTGADSTIELVLSAFDSVDNMLFAWTVTGPPASTAPSLTLVETVTGTNGIDTDVYWYDGEETAPEASFFSWNSSEFGAFEIKEAGGAPASTLIPGTLSLFGVGI